MGAFILTAKTNIQATEAGLQTLMSDKGFKEPRIVSFADFVVYQYDKIISDESHYREKNNCHFFFSGTPIYKNAASISSSIDSIVDAILNNNFNFNNVRGAYAVLFTNAKAEFSMLTDQAGIFNVYYNSSFTAFSNLFLATIFATPGKLSFNRFAATEVMMSGRQVGPDSLLNEIKKYEVFTDKGSLGPVTIVNDDKLVSPVHSKRSGFDTQVDEQIKALDDYFSDIKPFAENYGIDSGITGGHDSRMMLILLKRHISNFSLHSLWRKKEDVELSVAKNVAAAAKIHLNITPVKHHFDKTDSEMSDNLSNALLFYDGHIRMHCFLTEEYNTPKHRLEIMGNKRLGMNGIGGEQYRNEEHMEVSRWPMSYFIKYFLAYHLGGTSFTDSRYEEEFFTYLKNKIVKRLGLDPKANHISRADVKRYMNEIYVTSLMSARTNAENQLTHFITPYVDRQLTLSAYHALPHLGISFAFQQAMIRKMDPQLAGVRSGYGYDFNEGEPLKKKLKYIVKELTPRNVYQSKLDKAIDNKGNDEFNLFLEKFPVLRSSVELLREYKIPLDEKRLSSCPDLMPVYLSLAYFLKYLNTRNKLQGA